MQFLKKNILTICCMALVVLFGTVDNAFAVNSGDLMTTAQGKAVAVFISVKKIIFVVGGFGLVALAFMAIFGKVDWKKFAALATGLAILAAAGAIVDYATGATEGGKLKDNFRSSDSGVAMSGPDAVQSSQTIN